MLLSPTNTVPLAFTVIPVGREKREVVPNPFLKALYACPAIVVTAPDGVIIRMRELTVSATKRFPFAATARPKTPEKELAVPQPSSSELLNTWPAAPPLLRLPW